MKISKELQRSLEEKGLIAKSEPSKRSMNKLESAYVDRLWAMQTCGEIMWYAWEAIKLRLADKTWYTPDFAVLRRNEKMVFVETKGFMRDDAAVKLKVAAEQFPFQFYLAKKVNGEWIETLIPGKRIGS